MADQNCENYRLNQNLRKTKNKTSFRVDFESTRRMLFVNLYTVIRLTESFWIKYRGCLCACMCVCMCVFPEPIFRNSPADYYRNLKKRLSILSQNCRNKSAQPWLQFCFKFWKQKFRICTHTIFKVLLWIAGFYVIDFYWKW